MSIDELEKLFGVSDDAVEKSGNILPTLQIGNEKDFPVGSKLIIEFLSKEPKEIEANDKFNKGKKKKVSVMEIKVDTVFRLEEGKSLLEVPYNGEKFTLWLSSKSLALGIAKIWKDNNFDLTGKKAKISITLADYKEYGENRCYNTVAVN